MVDHGVLDDEAQTQENRILFILLLKKKEKKKGSCALIPPHLGFALDLIEIKLPSHVLLFSILSGLKINDHQFATVIFFFFFFLVIKLFLTNITVD